MFSQTANPGDAILVAGLELSAHIGVPDEERRRAQRLTVDLKILPTRPLSHLNDELAATIDYFALTRGVQQLCTDRPRKLIETLAEEICAFVLDTYPVREIEVELRKYILCDAQYVAIRLTRTRAASS